MVLYTSKGIYIIILSQKIIKTCVVSTFLASTTRVVAIVSILCVWRGRDGSNPWTQTILVHVYEFVIDLFAFHLLSVYCWWWRWFTAWAHESTHNSFLLSCCECAQLSLLSCCEYARCLSSRCKYARLSSSLAVSVPSTVVPLFMATFFNNSDSSRRTQMEVENLL